MNENEIRSLPRWHIKEPDHKEFERFKKNFLLNKATTTKEKELLRYIGELQSQVDELKHVVDTMKNMNDEQYKQLLIFTIKTREKAEREYKEKLHKHGNTVKKQRDSLLKSLMEANARIKELEDEAENKNNQSETGRFHSEG